MAGNKSLKKAKDAKNDEFYTQIEDIEREMKHYRDHFKDKTIFCNCDDPEYSNFWKYFQLNFYELGLKQLVSTHYEEDSPSYRMDNLTAAEQEQILDYKLMIYICEGNDKEVLDWFRVINIAGEKLTDQELRNAVYTGEWLTEAKKYFSKSGCPAYSIGNKLLNGTPIRQDYLQTALKWIAARDGKVIEEYMSEHQHDTNANELWLYFQSVINWVNTIFPHYRKEMKGIEWGFLYNTYHTQNYDSKKLENRILELIDDDEVDTIKGIYEYLFDGEEKHLNLRQFDDKTKRKVYEKQGGICANCGNHFEITEMEADHIDPWHDGGKTTIENCQMLCKHCNRVKSGK